MASAQQFSCADILEKDFDAKVYFEVLEPELKSQPKRTHKKTQKKLKKLLKKFGKIQDNPDKMLGSHEIAAFSGRLFGLLRKDPRKSNLEAAVYTLAQEQLLKDKIVQQFARDGRLDETRLRNRIKELLSHPRFRRLTDAVFFMWFLPEIRSIRLDPKVVESVGALDAVDLDPAARKSLRRVMRFTRLRSLYLKFMTITSLAYGGVQMYEAHAKAEVMQVEQARQFDENIMKPLEQSVEELASSDTDLDINTKSIHEFEQEFAAKHGRAPGPSDEDYQLILKIYGAHP